MAEIGTAVASKIIERAVDAIVVRARYLFGFNKFVIDLRKSKRELEKTLQHMKECAKEATINAEKIVQPVEEWLKNVEKFLEDAQKLEEKVEENQCCLNVTLQYSLAKEVIRMTQQMNMLNSNNKFEPFSHPIELSSMNYFFPKDFVALDSRKPVYEMLLKAIQDDNSSVIGLVGMAGSGKSALARVVGKQVEESKLFDKVVMTVVSQDFKVRDIQGQIADHLNFSLMEETELGRALRLSHRLKTEKILIILDDVWEKLDLEAIGIQLNKNDKRCCILFTTRNLEVCTSMNCESIIELCVLTEDDGWTLFKQRAQIHDDSPEDLREVAKRVFDKCQGLLSSILTVASTLKGKNFMNWELALSRLETCQSIDVQESLTSTYECNELDEIICLDSKTAGQLRYMYAPSLPVFPTLRKILIKGCHKMRKVFFPSVVSSLPELKELCVHDCIELVEIISSYSLEEARQLPNPSFTSQQVSFPKLEVIEIKRCNKLKTIFFEISISSLPELKELSVYDCNKLENLISSDSEEEQQQRNLTSPSKEFFPKLCKINIENCNNLKTFFFMSMVTSLPELQQLVVKDCNKWEEIIFSESEQGRQFKNPSLHQQLCFPKLRSIQIERCNKLKTIFSMMIVTCLPELIELIVKDCNELVETISLNSEQARQVGNLSVLSKEVCFPKLQRIEIESCKKLKTIFSADIVTRFPELEQLVIKDCNEWEEIISLGFEEVGDLKKVFVPSQQICFPNLLCIRIERCCKFKRMFSATIVKILPRLTQLVVKDCNEWVEIISLDPEDAGQQRNLPDPYQQVCFRNLREVEIERCNKLKAIFSATIVTSLPELVQLVLHDCNELEELVSLDSEEARQQRNLSSPCQQVCFPKLKTISIQKCNKLKTIFNEAMLTSLMELDHLDVRDCNELEHIISFPSVEVKQLRNLSTPSEQVCFPKLQNVWIQGCNKMKTIFFETNAVSLPSLQSLYIADCDNLEAIISPYSMEAECFKYLSAPPHQVCFPKLGDVVIVRCNNMKTIFFTTIVSSLPELKILYVLDCNKFEDVISSDSKEVEPLGNLSTPSKEVFFPKLKTIEIQKCNRLRKIFSLTTVGSLPELKNLHVNDSNGLEEILSLDSEEATQVENFSSLSQRVCFPKLESIWIHTCNKMKFIFSCSVASHCPSLHWLEIESCSQLEQIVKHKATSEEVGGAINDDHGKHLLFPNLTSLRLKKLPTLTGILPWFEYQYRHLFQYGMTIEDCPKYLFLPLYTIENCPKYLFLPLYN